MNNTLSTQTVNALVTSICKPSADARYAFWLTQALLSLVRLSKKEALLETRSDVSRSTACLPTPDDARAEGVMFEA